MGHVMIMSILGGLLGWLLASMGYPVNTLEFWGVFGLIFLMFSRLGCKE